MISYSTPLETPSLSELADPSCPLPSPMGIAEFSAAYEEGFRKTVRLIRFHGASPDIAEEVAQAAWARGWQYRRQLQEPKSAGAWVNTIALNLFRANKQLWDRFQEFKDDAIPTTILRELELGGVLEECTFQELRLISLFYFEGFSTLEISEKEQACPSTIRVRLMRIRRKLREKLA
jgi:DNA-directed RNA polymerase specialized sigma24 family protein